MIQCSLTCNDDENCGAFDWDESIHQCTLISNEGLFCDVNSINSVTAKLSRKVSTLPSTCQEGEYFSTICFSGRNIR